MRINVGCGKTPVHGWRNFDNSASIHLAKVPFLPAILTKLRLLSQAQNEFIEFLRSNRIEHADATTGLPIKSGTVEVLYSSHMIEHLDPDEVLLFLQETLRVLRPGGIIRLAVPDIRKQVDSYQNNGDADAFIRETYLAQPRPRSLTSRLRIVMVGARHHQWMYDGRSLCRLLTTNGFSRAEVVSAGKSRIPNPEPLDLFERSAESVYVEAEKR